jgi:hypothetical protein
MSLPPRRGYGRVGSWSLAKKLGNLGRLVTMRSCKGREGVACIIGVLLRVGS